jgi:hypothetical protein
MERGTGIVLIFKMSADLCLEKMFIRMHFNGFPPRFELICVHHQNHKNLRSSLFINILLSIGIRTVLTLRLGAPPLALRETLAGHGSAFLHFAHGVVFSHRV